MCKRFFQNILCIMFVIGTVSVSAQTNEKLERELIDRISKSRAELSTIEKQIGQERVRYASRLDKNQDDIGKLRSEAGALQRLADEQLLGLEKLQTRVELWSTQSNYQRHLLTSYVESMALPTSAFATTDGAPQIDARALTIALEHFISTLNPSWQDADIISSEGKILTMPTLLMGPVEVTFDAGSNSGGLITRDNASEPRVLDVFDSTNLAELSSLQQEGLGYLSFDPTLGNALQLRASEDSLFTHVQKGGVWAIPIILFGLISLIISLVKGWQLLRLPKVDTTLVERINSRVAEHSKQPLNTPELRQQFQTLARDTNTAQQKLLHIGLDWPVSQQRDDLLVAYLMEYKHRLERYVGVVAISAAIAPLLGLLGTVSGMIATFQMMTIFGSGDASTVSGGISEALVTTELGLIVAIPSLLISALLTRRIKSYTHQLENFAIKLSKISFTA